MHTEMAVMLAKMLRRNAAQIETGQSPAYEPLRRYKRCQAGRAN